MTASGTVTSSTVTLSVDELRAVARVDGLLLPSMLLDDADLDAGLRDAVAVRGLLARGLVALHADALVTTVSLAALLSPLRAPGAVAELEREAAGVRLRTAAVEGPGGLLMLVEREPDVWILELRAEELAVLLVPLLEECTGGDEGLLALARRDGTTYVLDQAQWDTGEQALSATAALLASAP